MEFNLSALEGQDPPGEAYVSVRIGKVQKQARFAASRSFHFPDFKEDRPEFARIDVYNKVGTTLVPLADLQNSPKDVRLCLGGSDLGVRVEVVSDCLKPSERAKEKARRSREMLDQTQKYMAEHHLEELLSRTLRDMMRDQPADPASFLSDRLVSNKKARMQDVSAAVGQEEAQAQGGGTAFNPAMCCDNGLAEVSPAICQEEAQAQGGAAVNPAMCCDDAIPEVSPAMCRDNDIPEVSPATCRENDIPEVSCDNDIPELTCSGGVPDIPCDSDAPEAPASAAPNLVAPVEKDASIVESCGESLMISADAAAVALEALPNLKTELHQHAVDAYVAKASQQPAQPEEPVQTDQEESPSEPSDIHPSPPSSNPAPWNPKDADLRRLPTDAWADIYQRFDWPPVEADAPKTPEAGPLPPLPLVLPSLPEMEDAEADTPQLAPPPHSSPMNESGGSSGYPLFASASLNETRVEAMASFPSADVMAVLQSDSADKDTYIKELQAAISAKESKLRCLAAQLQELSGLTSSR